jgi:hypothetical protein
VCNSRPLVTSQMRTTLSRNCVPSDDRATSPTEPYVRNTNAYYLDRLQDESTEIPFGNLRRYRVSIHPQHRQGFYNQLLKVDVRTGGTQTWFEENCYPGEPVFVGARVVQFSLAPATKRRLKALRVFRDIWACLFVKVSAGKGYRLPVAEVNEDVEQSS